MIAPQDVLAFWFGHGPLVWRPVWFEKHAMFDTACGQFAAAVTAARDGALDAWTVTPRDTLALLLLLDQFPRNLYRASPGAFAADLQAQAVARMTVARGFDLPLHPVERCFVYLPFEHSEDLADQDDSVRLFETLRDPLDGPTIDYAHRHRDVIRRFGRFPHRNATLGRTSTPDEMVYLAEPEAGF
jgi:uncharacterized protein (DUF924 family)